jgi:hypothetical protein
MNAPARPTRGCGRDPLIAKRVPEFNGGGREPLTVAAMSLRPRTCACMTRGAGADGANRRPKNCALRRIGLATWPSTTFVKAMRAHEIGPPVYGERDEEPKKFGSRETCGVKSRLGRAPDMCCLLPTSISRFALLLPH